MARDLTPEEVEILLHLSAAFQKFKRLPALHKFYRLEFAGHIHAAQHTILSRPALEALQQRGDELAQDLNGDLGGET